MGDYVASQIVKCMIKKNIPVNGARVLILGITFKENCPDVRNTKVVDVITALNEYNTDITIYDPWANTYEVNREYDIDSTKEIPKETFDAIVLTVAHNKFRELDLNALRNDNAIIYDVKNVLGENVDAKL